MRRGTLARLGALLAVGALALGACSSNGGGGSSGGGGTVNIAINPWVGYEANAAVVGCIAHSQLGATVTEKNLKEEILAGLRERRRRRDPRELGPRRPRQEVHRHRQGR
jgi:glycine betaine/proline transport system substrate-binding protein